MLAHAKNSESLQALANSSNKNTAIFNNDAIKKMGFNPFTGKQFLAAPTVKKEHLNVNATVVNVSSITPEMIELEIDEED